METIELQLAENQASIERLLNNRAVAKYARLLDEQVNLNRELSKARSAAKAQAKRDFKRNEWLAYVDGMARQAIDACNTFCVNAAGEARGVDVVQIITNWVTPAKYATEELLNWMEANPVMSFKQYSKIGVDMREADDFPFVEAPDASELQAQGWTVAA